MSDLIFNGLKVVEMELTNRIQGQRKLDIEQRANFNVKYTNDNKHCVANLTIDMMDKTTPMDFNFKISVEGFMDVDGEMERKEIHKAAYDELYPHVRSIVMTVMVNSGLPPITIPKVRMDDSNIKIGGKDNPERNGLYS